MTLKGQHSFMLKMSINVMRVCVCFSDCRGERRSRSGRSGVSQDPRIADHPAREACSCMPGQDHAGHMFRLPCLIGGWVWLSKASFHPANKEMADSCCAPCAIDLTDLNRSAFFIYYRCAILIVDKVLVLQFFSLIFKYSCM